MVFYKVTYQRSIGLNDMNYDEQLKQLIAKRAHEYSQMRKNGCGDDVSDWLKAEQEILGELNHRSCEILSEFRGNGNDPAGSRPADHP